MSYDKYASRAPPGKLQQVLDDENQGVDLHLVKIAERLDERMMANELCPELGITGREIRDIQRANPYNPQQMRMEFLSKWKQKEGIDATYENLVRKLLKVGDKSSALAIVDLWGHPMPASQPRAGTAAGTAAPRRAGAGGKIELSMKHLGFIKYTEGGENKRFSLRDRVNTKWRAIGLLLNIETNTLEGYDRQTQGSSMECWTKVMQRWMDGQGTNEYPKSWDGLYEILRDVDLSQVATELRNAVEKAI